VDKQLRVRVDAGVPVAARDTLGMEDEQASELAPSSCSLPTTNRSARQDCSTTNPAVCDTVADESLAAGMDEMQK
jgi:hypothetical protein